VTTTTTVAATTTAVTTTTAAPGAILAWYNQYVSPDLKRLNAAMVSVSKNPYPASTPAQILQVLDSCNKLTSAVAFLDNVSFVHPAPNRRVRRAWVAFADSVATYSGRCPGNNDAALLAALGVVNRQLKTFEQTVTATGA
jgi:hypothetical protein